MENQNPMTEYSIFRFLRHLPIPDRLKINVPGLDILSTKVPLPAVLEQSISLSSLFTQKKKPIKRRIQKASSSEQKQEIIPAAGLAATGALSKGFDTHFSVSGHDILISETTWIFGELRYGSQVQVFGSKDHKGIIAAQKIIVM